MIRRFELYSVASDAPPLGVSALEGACRRCGEFIPEVLFSHVGWNLSDAPVHLVWEHAFASVEAYRRYMVHPFHADVLDRYLLNDAPERVVSDNGLGAGLVGYDCPRPVFAMAGGVRRLVLMRLDRQAPPSEVRRLTDMLGDAPEEAGQMTLSVVGANTLGAAWFDGVTPVAGPVRWTHLWEQGFSGLDALDAYLDGTSVWAAAERDGWDGPVTGIVRSAVAVHYRIDGTAPDR